MGTWLTKNILYLAWVQALVSTLGSLYASEILGFPPCVLCWYQRIFMYPLVLILPIGIFKKDRNLPDYVIPLASLGGLVALYQNLLSWKVISETLAPCAIGVSCLTKYVNYFGFITIPLLSLLSFVVIISCMVVYKRLNSKS
ncbi:MAG: disulfide oxidoreductase [bacterium]|nr:disulfide oxidoreductase [bacterium]